MYDKTVTVFNFCDIGNGAMWYPHVISGVDILTDKGVILKKYGPNSTDRAELHISYTEQEGSKVITDVSGNDLSWIPPKVWKRQESDILDKTITFASTNDFFILGAWEGGSVNDDDYRNGFYSYMNDMYDFCYKISSVGGPYDLIPHFEIMGA